MRETGPTIYSSNAYGASRAPAPGPDTGTNFEQNLRPVLSAFAVQGVSQASDTGADEAIQWQVTVTDAGRK